MEPKRCDDCLLHSNMVREDERADKKIDMVRKELCAKISKVETNIMTCKKEEHFEMWKAITNKTPRWAFILSLGLMVTVLGGFGTLITSMHNSQAAVMQRMERTDAVISTELPHIKDALKNIERNQRRIERGGR